MVEEAGDCARLNAPDNTLSEKARALLSEVDGRELLPVAAGPDGALAHALTLAGAARFLPEERDEVRAKRTAPPPTLTDHIYTLAISALLSVFLLLYALLHSLDMDDGYGTTMVWAGVLLGGLLFFGTLGSVLFTPARDPSTKPSRGPHPGVLLLPDRLIVRRWSEAARRRVDVFPRAAIRAIAEVQRRTTDLVTGLPSQYMITQIVHEDAGGATREYTLDLGGQRRSDLDPDGWHNAEQARVEATRAARLRELQAWFAGAK